MMSPTLQTHSARLFDVTSPQEARPRTGTAYARARQYNMVSAPSSHGEGLHITGRRGIPSLSPAQGSSLFSSHPFDQLVFPNSPVLFNVSYLFAVSMLFTKVVPHLWYLRGFAATATTG